jgi:hypothetical protein
MKTSYDPPWSKYDEQFLQDNINKMPVSDLASALKRTENSINIKAHRMRLDRRKGGILKENVARNYIHEMLTQRIGKPEYFRYTPEFRTRTGINQKRFWQLYRGEKNLTIDEFKILMREFNITINEVFELNQLTLEFSE